MQEQESCTVLEYVVWHKIGSVFFEKTGAFILRWILRLTHTLWTFMETLNSRCTYPETSGCRHLFSGAITNAGPAWPPHPHIWCPSSCTNEGIDSNVGMLCYRPITLYYFFISAVCVLATFWISCGNVFKSLAVSPPPSPKFEIELWHFRPYKSDWSFLSAHCELKLPYFAPLLFDVVEWILETSFCEITFSLWFYCCDVWKPKCSLLASPDVSAGRASLVKPVRIVNSVTYKWGLSSMSEMRKWLFKYVSFHKEINLLWSRITCKITCMWLFSDLAAKSK